MADYPEIDEYTGDIPNRLTQSSSVFSTNMAAFQNWMPTAIEQVNDAGQFVEEQAEFAGESADNAAISATSAAGSANWKGVWDDASGSGVAGTTYSYGAYIYLLKVNLSDVTSIEPSTDDDTWQLVNVSDTVANIDWDFEATFNDGLGIDKGYSSDVTVTIDGDDYVTPSGEVDFTRASTTGSINKSGVFETLEEDEPMICSEGLGVFGSYTNLLTYSEDIDFGTGSWLRSNTLVDSTGDTETKNNVSMNLIESTNTTAASFLYQDASMDGSLVAYTSSVFASFGDSDYFKLSIFYRTSSTQVSSGFIVVDSQTGEVSTSTGVDRYNVKMYGDVICASVTMTNTSETSTVVRTALTPSCTSTGASLGESGSTYFGGAQCTESAFLLPYAYTDSSASAISSSQPSFQISKNMPPIGSSFTAVIDGALGGDNDNNRWLCFADSSLLMVRDSATDQRYVVTVLGVQISSSSIDSEYQNKSCRYAVSYDSESSTAYFYRNGVLISSSTVSGFDVSDFTTDGDIYIGKWSGDQYNNGYIKNFRIIHRALTDAEIAALGSAS